MKEMPVILFRDFDENIKNLKCKSIIEKVCDQFFSFDIQEIESALNDKRKFLVLQWANKGFHNKIIYKSKEIEFTHEKGLCELVKEFKLNCPKTTIEINIKKGYRKNQSPAETIFSGGEFDFISYSFRNFQKIQLNVFIDLLDLVDDNIVWPDRNYYFKDIIYHELIHICGDLVCDGVLRHNIVGIDTIKELMDGI